MRNPNSRDYETIHVLPVLLRLQRNTCYDQPVANDQQNNSYSSSPEFRTWSIKDGEREVPLNLSEHGFKLTTGDAGELQ